MDKRCVLAFTSLYIDPSGDIRPCCVSKNFPEPINLNDFKTVDEVKNHQQFKNLRKSMIDGSPMSMCDTCYIGGTDLMNHWNKEWAHKLKDPYLYNQDLEVESIHYLDARFSNICNFKCRMCWPGLSSSWYQDYLDIYGEKGKIALDHLQTLDDNAIAKFSDKDLDALEHLNVAGGEPFITADFFRLLDRITDEQASKISVVVTTNLSTLFYKRRNVIDMLSRFKRVNIQASCDGFGELGEYQRTGFSTKKFFDNLEMLGELSNKYTNIDTNIEYTITTLNMFHMFEFLEYIDKNTFLNPGAVHFHWAVGPAGFCPGIIPEDLKQQVSSYVLENKDKYEANIVVNFERFLTWINKPSKEHAKVTYSTEGEFLVKELDKVRNTSYIKLFPWMDKIFEYQKRFFNEKLSII